MFLRWIRRLAAAFTLIGLLGGCCAARRAGPGGPPPRRTACRNNLRQFSIAIEAYLGDSGDYMPADPGRGVGDYLHFTEVQSAYDSICVPYCIPNAHLVG